MTFNEIKIGSTFRTTENRDMPVMVKNDDNLTATVIGVANDYTVRIRADLVVYPARYTWNGMTF